MASNDEVLHAANVLVCGGGLLAADTITGGAASMIGGMLSWREVNRKRSEHMTTLQTHVAGRLRELIQDTGPDDPRYHLPDMIRFAAPTPADVKISGRDATTLTEHLLNRAQEAQPGQCYETHAYKSAFRLHVGQLLDEILASPNFADVLAPAFQAAVLTQFADVQRKLDIIVADVGSLAAALSRLERLPRDQLETLALRFEIEGIYDLTDDALRDSLEEKAKSYRSLKQQIAALDENVAEIARIKAAAEQAAADLEFEKVHDLLSAADVAETTIAAKTKIALANNALLIGRVEKAYHILSAVADSFRSVDSDAPATIRGQLYELLYDHGVRFAGDGIVFCRENAPRRARRTARRRIGRGARTHSRKPRELASGIR